MSRRRFATTWTARPSVPGLPVIEGSAARQSGTLLATGRENGVVETATRTLHRLTWFAQEWYDSGADVFGPPVDDPRVVDSFEPNDLDRLPWPFKQ